MSRTTRKNIRTGVCCGSNTKWYRDRTHIMRHRFNNNFKTLLSNFDIGEVEDLVLNPKFPKRDSWNEPTDGTHLITSKNAHNYEEFEKNINRQLRNYKKNKYGFNKK